MPGRREMSRYQMPSINSNVYIGKTYGTIYGIKCLIYQKFKKKCIHESMKLKIQFTKPMSKIKVQRVDFKTKFS